MRRNKIVYMLFCIVTITGVMLGTSCAGDGGGGITPTEEPQYGGTLTIPIPRNVDPDGFDDVITMHSSCSGNGLVTEEVWTGDWAAGDAGGYGTGESPWCGSAGLNRLEYKAPALAEKVEWSANLTEITLTIRSGVYWHNKPPTNGRELTAEDVRYSLQRQYTDPAGYMKRTYPGACNATTISVDGNKVILEIADPEYFVDVITMLDFMYIYPKDALDYYGDMTQWENLIGTGPFILTEYVSGDHLSYVRNEDYWMTNPVGPGAGDQLPYVENVELYVLPDASSRDSLFISGQIDVLDVAIYSEAQAVIENCPDAEYKEFLNDANEVAIFFNMAEGKPFHDERVRWALSLAIDYQEIFDTLHGGEGAILKWPIMELPSYENAYVSLDDLEEDTMEVLPGRLISTADLWGYNPELAGELLAEAGYSDGFSAQLVFYDVPQYRDPLTMVVAMWEEVGVHVTLVPKAYLEVMGMQLYKTYTDMIYGWYAGIGAYMKGTNYCGPGSFNVGNINDPVLNQAREDMLAAYPDEDAVDAIHRLTMHYIHTKCYAIGLPSGYYYRFWWPWVRNYNGEMSVGYYNHPNFAKFIWIDEDLKEAMGY